MDRPVRIPLHAKKQINKVRDTGGDDSRKSHFGGKVRRHTSGPHSAAQALHKHMMKRRAYERAGFRTGRCDVSNGVPAYIYIYIYIYRSFSLSLSFYIYIYNRGSMAKESRRIRFIHGRTLTQNDVWNTVGAEIDVGDGS